MRIPNEVQLLAPPPLSRLKGPPTYLESGGPPDAAGEATTTFRQRMNGDVAKNTKGA